MKFLGIITLMTSTGGILATMEGVSIEVGGYERGEVLANGEVKGYFNKPVAPKISAKFAIGPDFDLEGLRNFTGGEVVAQGDNGISFTLEGAWTASPPKISDNNGGCEIEFKGKRCAQAKLAG
jgi:hypothetical protein